MVHFIGTEKVPGIARNPPVTLGLGAGDVAVLMPRPVPDDGLIPRLGVLLTIPRSLPLGEASLLPAALHRRYPGRRRPLGGAGRPGGHALHRGRRGGRARAPGPSSTSPSPLGPPPRRDAPARQGRRGKGHCWSGGAVGIQAPSSPTLAYWSRNRASCTMVVYGNRPPPSRPGPL